MLKRSILKSLTAWKNRSNKKPLILRGARQVGKSTTVAELGKQYTYFVSLNLEKSAHAKFFIDYGDDVKQIAQAIALAYNVEIIKGKTLLFIDEIQEQPKAIALLRYFYEDMPELDVIAAGSLLEFSMDEVPSFPVGRVEQLPMYPLNFEEFLLAMNEKTANDLYCNIPIPDYAHDKLLQLFHHYILIGGMPEVVNEYVNNQQKISELNRIYASIWDNYRDDIEKYGNSNKEKKILQHIMHTAPMVRDRITFNGFGASQYQSREVSEAFRKLHKAGIIKLIYPTTDLQPPMIANIKRKPKIQFLDTGVLNYASHVQQDLIHIQDLNSLFRGYIVNHIVFQELISINERLHEVPFFWTRESTTANAEVDIVVQHKNMIIPIEIKSGAKGSLKSLHEFMERCNHPYAFRLLGNKFNIEKSTTRSGKIFLLINLPYYCLGKIYDWIDYVIDNSEV